MVGVSVMPESLAGTFILPDMSVVYTMQEIFPFCSHYAIMIASIFLF
jgi:hypothetical protein